MNNFPNLIIIGVHKAATTSLFMHLKKHPAIYGPGKKELHYFTPARYGDSLAPIDEYTQHYRDRGTEKYALEASPSYLYGKERVIDLMKSTLSGHKVIVVLRNPADRFVSFYRHLKSKLLIKDSENFHSFLSECAKRSKEPDKENYYYRGIREGMYADFLPPWMEAYGKNLKIVLFEAFKENPLQVMKDLADWLEIDVDFFETIDYTVENKTVFTKNQFLQKIALTVNDQLEWFFRKNHRLKIWLRTKYYKFNATKSEEQIAPSDRRRLEEIYVLPNKQLTVLIEKHEQLRPEWAS